MRAYVCTYQVHKYVYTYIFTSIRIFMHTYIHTYIHQYIVIRQRGVWLRLLRARRSEGECGISVKLRARPCYNIYVTLLIGLYSIARNYPGITTLQVRYYAVKRYHWGQPHVSEAEEKTRLPKTEGSATIPNHVDGSRNHLESLLESGNQ